jgi:anti-sigma B factor antagonist
VQRFKLVECERDDGCWEIQVVGELDLAVSDQLDEKLEGAVDESERILIGLERCAFIDSSGIAVILRAHQRMAERRRRLAVYGPTDQVLRVLSITGLTANGLVFDSAEEALSAFGASS